MDLLGQEIVGRHDQIVTGSSGQQLALQRLVGVKHVVDGLDPGLLLKVTEGGLADIIGPVVKMNHRGCLGQICKPQGQGQRCHLGHVHLSVLVCVILPVAHPYAPSNLSGGHHPPGRTADREGYSSLTYLI